MPPEEKGPLVLYKGKRMTPAERDILRKEDAERKEKRKEEEDKT